MAELLDLKLKVARAQLATALDLFIRDKDPYSVQCLACGGGEVLDELAALKGAVPLSKLMLQTYPDYNEAKLRGVRNLYWNAFKHLMNRDGVLRDDEKLLARFDDLKTILRSLLGGGTTSQ